MARTGPLIPASDWLDRPVDVRGVVSASPLGPNPRCSSGATADDSKTHGFDSLRVAIEGLSTGVQPCRSERDQTSVRHVGVRRCVGG